MEGKHVVVASTYENIPAVGNNGSIETGTDGEKVHVPCCVAHCDHPEKDSFACVLGASHKDSATRGEKDNGVDRDSMLFGTVNVQEGDVVISSKECAPDDSTQGAPPCPVPDKPVLNCHCENAGNVAIARQSSRFVGQAYVTCSKPRGRGHGRCRYFALLCDCVRVATTTRIREDENLYEMFSCDECGYMFVDPNPLSDRFINH